MYQYSLQVKTCADLLFVTSIVLFHFFFQFDIAKEEQHTIEIAMNEI